MGLRLREHPHLQTLMLANVAMILNHHRLCRVQVRPQVRPQTTLNLIQLYQATEQIGAFQKRVIRPLAQVLFASLHRPSFWTRLGDWVLTQLAQWQNRETPPPICLTVGLLPLLTTENDPFSWQETIVIQVMALEAAHRLVESLPIESLEATGLESLLGLTDTLIEDSSAFDPRGFEPVRLGLPIIPTALAQDHAQDGSYRLPYQIQDSAVPQNQTHTQPPRQSMLDAGTVQAIRRLPSLSFTLCHQGPLAIPAQRVLSQWIWKVSQRFGTEVAYVGLLLVDQVTRTAQPWQEGVQLEGQEMLPQLHWQTRSQPSHQLKKLARLVRLLCQSQVALEVRDVGDRLAVSSQSLLWQLDQLTVSRRLQMKDPADHSAGSYEAGMTQAVTLGLKPGAWIQRFAQVYGERVYSQLRNYGRLARQILSIDPYADRLAAKLAIFLTYHYDLDPGRVWTVADLLMAVEPPEHIQALVGNSIRRQQVFQDWNQVLTIFHRIGWLVTFDPSSYALAIQPRWSEAWSQAQTDAQSETSQPLSVDWLQAKLSITPMPMAPPFTIQPMTESVPEQRRSPRRQMTTIPSEVLEQALAAKGMSQAKLARSLNLDRSTINRWINGSRPIHARYRPLLWDLLGDAIQQVSS